MASKFFKDLNIGQNILENLSGAGFKAIMKPTA